MLIHNRLSYYLQPLASTTTFPKQPKHRTDYVQKERKNDRTQPTEEKSFLMFTNIVAAKVLPTVKSTSVNVIIDDVGTNTTPPADAADDTNDQNHEAVSGTYGVIPQSDTAVAGKELQDQQQLPSVHKKEAPIRSASVCLSIELAKKTSMQSILSDTPSHSSASGQLNHLKLDQQKQKKHDVINTITTGNAKTVGKKNTRHKDIIIATAANTARKERIGDYSKAIDHQRPASIASHASNSILQRIAHSPKAAAANVYSTSVSANGNVIFDTHVAQTGHHDQQRHENGCQQQAQEHEKVEITDAMTEKKLYMRSRATATAAMESLLTNRIHYTPPSSPPSQRHLGCGISTAREEEYTDEDIHTYNNRLSSTITVTTTPVHSSSASSTTVSEQEDDNYSPIPTCGNRLTVTKEASYAAPTVLVASSSTRPPCDIQSTTPSMALNSTEKSLQVHDDHHKSANEKITNTNSSWWLSYFFPSKSPSTTAKSKQPQSDSIIDTRHSSSLEGTKTPSSTVPLEQNPNVESVKTKNIEVVTNDTKIDGTVLSLASNSKTASTSTTHHSLDSKNASQPHNHNKEEQQTDSVRRAKSVSSLPSNITPPSSIHHQQTAAALDKPHTRANTIASSALSIKTTSTTTTSEQRQNITVMSPMSSSPNHSHFSTHNHLHHSPTPSIAVATQVKRSSLNVTNASTNAAPTTTVAVQAQKPKNVVLPSISTLFTKRPIPPPKPVNKTPPQPTPTHPVNFITKIMDAINAVLIPPPPPKKACPPLAKEQDEHEEEEVYTTKHWIAKHMRAKFSHFIDDMKSTFGPSTAAITPPETTIVDSTEHAQPDTKEVPQTHGLRSGTDVAASVAAKKIMNNKRIVIVGVHGWFPMKLVRSMIGEPTGTSIKFCEQMATGIKHYFKEEHGVDLPVDDVITLVPLEGEGKVQDRVHQLYEKLLNNSLWLEAVSSADVVLWATHSQGTPVSMMLLHRLLERGHIHLIRQSVCVLAMAGISQGPFPTLKGSLIVKYFEADAARELFEFMDSSSPISVQFRASLAYILNRGVKVVLTGSMQDQVVPLYSAIMTSVDHPNLLRSVYIDGHLLTEKNDFLIHLVVFAVKLRNWGLSDYDLVVHLSEVLAGSLYALEGGHSTIYEELEVYMTAVRYTFETAPFGQYIRKTAVAGVEEQSAEDEKEIEVEEKEACVNSFLAKQQQNPFYLPWVLHSIMTDPQILANDSLLEDLKKLLHLFEQWHPMSARLKELKYRLDPIRTVKL